MYQAKISGTCPARNDVTGRDGEYLKQRRWRHSSGVELCCRVKRRVVVSWWAWVNTRCLSTPLPPQPPAYVGPTVTDHATQWGAHLVHWILKVTITTARSCRYPETAVSNFWSSGVRGRPQRVLSAGSGGRRAGSAAGAAVYPNRWYELNYY